MKKHLMTFLELLKHKREIRNCKCEYKILSDYDGYSLYRKLFTGEEKYYLTETKRLKAENGEIWLLLDKDIRLNILQSKLKKLKGKAGNA